MAPHVLSYGTPPSSPPPRKRSYSDAAIIVGLAISAAGWACEAVYYCHAPLMSFLDWEAIGSELTFAGLIVTGLAFLAGPNRRWAVAAIAVEVVAGCVGLRH